MSGDFGLPFMQARSYTKANRALGSIKWIVLHAMQAPEAAGTAEGTARFFATTTKASAHFCCDNDSTIQSVRLKDVAWGASGANQYGVHIEQAGFSEQDSAGWADQFSQQMIRSQVAPLVARLAVTCSIPLRFVDAAGLKRGDRGVTTHAEISNAFPSGGHWDPGPNYPIGQLLNLARSASGVTTTPVPTPGPSTPTPLPTFPPLKGKQVATLQRDNRIWQYKVTSDGKLHHSYWDGISWHHYEIGAGCDPHAQIDAIFYPLDSTDTQVFAPTLDGRVFHAWWFAPEVRFKTEYFYS